MSVLRASRLLAWHQLKVSFICECIPCVLSPCMVVTFLFGQSGEHVQQRWPICILDECLALIPRHEDYSLSHSAWRAPSFDWPAGSWNVDPFFAVVTSTLSAVTDFGVEPSLIVPYFPKGRPP